MGANGLELIVASGKAISEENGSLIPKVICYKMQDSGVETIEDGSAVRCMGFKDANTLAAVMEDGTRHFRQLKTP